MEKMFTTSMDNTGRIYIPTEWRDSAKLKKGDDVILRLEDSGRIVILSRADALEEIRKISRKRKRKGVSVVDELIAERRTELIR